MPSPQYSAWCFTLNNFTQDNIKNLLGVAEFKYIIFGEEKGEEKGTNHLQGYFELDKKKTFNGVKKLLLSYDKILDKVHLESRRGSQQKAIDYCKKGSQSKSEWEQLGSEGPNFGKDKVIHENGSQSKQGKRSDLDNVRHDAEENGMRSITTWGNMQQIKVAQSYLTYNEKPRKCPKEMKVIYICGPTGVGKTTLAYELAGKEFYEWCPASQGKWWDGYDGHETIIIDDLSSTDINAKFMLKLLGGFGLRLEVKGGFRQCKAKTIIITSLDPPDKLWDRFAVIEPYAQFRRRITEIRRIVPLSKGVAKSGSKKSRGNTKDLLLREVRPLSPPPPGSEDFPDLEASDLE